MEVPLAVAAGVPVDQADPLHLHEVVLDVDGGLVGAHHPELAVDNRGVVPVAPSVVALGGQAEEGALGVDG